MQSERWANIGREILFSARSELYMNLPFLDGALAALPVQDGFETSSLATDAKALYFSGAWLAQRFERSRTERQPRLSAHGLSLSVAPSGENARPRPRSLVARVRYCSRKPARQSGLPLPHAGQDLGAAAQPLPLAARAYARADGRGGLPPFPPRTHEFLRLCDAHARVRGRRAHALARG